MQERHSRSVSSGRAATSTTRKGMPGTQPWNPALAPRPIVPAPPPPTPRASVATRKGYEIDEDGDTRFYRGRSKPSTPAPAPSKASVPAPAPRLWGDARQEPSATASVTQGELEEIRRQLHVEPPRRTTVASSPPLRVEDTDRSVHAARSTAAAVMAPRGVLKPLLGIAALTIFASAIAAHQTGNLPRVDLTQLPRVELDVGPVLSTLGEAQTMLHARYEELFAGARPHAPAPVLPRPTTPPEAQAPVPVVEQLQEGVAADAANQTLLSELPEEGLAPLSMDPSLTTLTESPMEAEGSEPEVESQELDKGTHGRRAARGKGVLRLNSQPWSEIYVDDKLMGHTPEMHLELPAGRHNIRLKNSDHNLVKTFTIDIAPGKVQTRIVQLRESTQP